MAENVEYILKLRDEFSKKMGKADKEAKEFNNTTKLISKSLTKLVPIGVGAGAAIVFRKAVEVASQFEKEMSNVLAISQANQLQFLELQQQAEGLGRTTAFSAKQAAEAMSFLSMAGLNVKDTMAALPGTLDLAAAGTIDLGKAADIASNVLTQFGLAANEMNRVNDVIVKTTTRANLNVEQLAEGLKFTGTTAKILKIPLEETAAALGVLGNAGLQGSMGGTSLNFALLEMSRISSPTAQKLKKLGIQTHGVNGEFVGLTDILEQFEKKGIKSTTILDTFGARGGRAMGTLVEAGSDAIKTLTKLNKESEGIAKTVAKMKLDNLAGDMTILKSASQGLAISFGKRMNPAMRDTIQFTTKLVNGFEKFVRIPMSETLRRDRIELNAQLNVLKNANTPLEIRKELMTEINQKYKEHIPNLLTEKSTLQDIEEVQKALNKELLRRIEIQAKEEFIQEKINKAVEIRNRLREKEIKLESTLEKIRQIRENGITIAEQENFRQFQQQAVSIERGVVRLRKKWEEANEEAQKAAAGSILDNVGTSKIQKALATTAQVTAEPSKQLTQQITSAAPKVFNINIQKLIETQEINTTTLKESTPQIKQQMIEALLEGLNESQTMISR